jgi:hypothetical protein
MAEMTTAQKQALGGMNISSDEEKLEELKAIQAKIKAEEARIKANIAEKKAAEANAQADAQLIAQARGLTGDRDGDGNLIPAEEEIPAAPDKGLHLTEEKSKIPTIEELNTWYWVMVKQAGEDWMENPIFKEQVEWYNEQKKLTGQETNSGFFNSKGEEIPIAEWDENQEFDADGNPIPVTLEELNLYEYKDNETTKTKQSDEQIADPEDDIEGDERTDAESEKMRHGGIDPEQGRTHPVESDVRNEKPGWEVAEGGNTWSINEKDDYWKTQEGFDEAMDLYGQKPSWLKEPTLVYNPETDEYEKIEEEEFEDLSRPTISADIKKLFG